jgi:hypothetical protein
MRIGINPANAQVRVLQGTPASQLSYNTIVSGVDTLNVSTLPNTAVFYSGGTRSVAEAYASTNGLRTLEQTSGGGYLDNIGLFDNTVVGVGRAEANAIWRQTSTNYAAQASGNVTAILDMQKLSPTGAFWQAELPTLLGNRSVTAITIRTTQGNTVVIPAGTSLLAARRMIMRVK